MIGRRIALRRQEAKYRFTHFTSLLRFHIFTTVLSFNSIYAMLTIASSWPCIAFYYCYNWLNYDFFHIRNIQRLGERLDLLSFFKFSEILDRPSGFEPGRLGDARQYPAFMAPRLCPKCIGWRQVGRGNTANVSLTTSRLHRHYTNMNLFSI